MDLYRRSGVFESMDSTSHIWSKDPWIYERLFTEHSILSLRECLQWVPGGRATDGDASNTGHPVDVQAQGRTSTGCAGHGGR